MTDQLINNDALAKTTITFVIGAPATGKTTFINNHFSDSGNTVILNVYDYQQAAYKEAGFGKYIPFGQEFKCLYKANENLLIDIIDTLQNGKNVVVEQTLFKAKHRISYIDAIRKAVDAEIEFFVMCPSDAKWEGFIAERKLQGNFQYHKSMAEEIEFPNPAEGIDRIFQVVDGDIQMRMDTPTPEILPLARQELADEADRMYQEEERKARHRELLDSMNTRPFWHYCEVCGKKVFCTAQEAFDSGWDYPPQLGTFGSLGPRTCGKCSITDTLWWKVQQQELPIVIEKDLTAEELKTWRRIKKEPESLLEEEK